ncbi:polysaccharide biosynthesis C-terminal domain-containing protein [Selenihalanaerobacter shriftii]|uniref:UDP-2-acetamido-2,6-beta-L-arabino-hexul-4-ose reductase n=1 Tax=Selenihalanaerobacter shriftii TaxID=142842 RepID=A0A1T4R111_9FIRM|nr:NAD-dependent epimerase/dehydratase family protein [Selenihalanaerobacter shriftii]SKA09536.1 UDP-2-acetamido-2,6-beta-L-arabino-hexul-4-ose reductase [Selenihalanaerobacter shriftii]
MNNILVTGSKGFIGQNFMETLQRQEDITILTFDKENSYSELKEMLTKADFIFHLAGVNRPENDEEFMKVNAGLTEYMTKNLIELNKTTPILITSSSQAELNNLYGESKKKAEEILIEYKENTGAPIYIYRLPNVFGKWCKPNYNSVVATFCHNISHDLDIYISDRNYELELVYIDDVVNSFMAKLNKEVRNKEKNYYSVRRTFKVTLGELADSIYQIKENRETLKVPDLGDGFMKALHATYLTYLEADDFAYDLELHSDERGSFVEVIKSESSGQVSVSTSVEGIKRGNHYHNTKNEKFLVLKGEALIKFRHIFSDEIIEYEVSGEEMKVVDIPPGYTHSIENLGDGEMILLIWANEIFDPNNTDTYYCEVE